jgi:hypothetical protein
MHIHMYTSMRIYSNTYICIYIIVSAYDTHVYTYVFKCMYIEVLEEVGTALTQKYTYIYIYVDGYRNMYILVYTYIHV